MHPCPGRAQISSTSPPDLRKLRRHDRFEFGRTLKSRYRSVTEAVDVYVVDPAVEKAFRSLQFKTVSLVMLQPKGMRNSLFALLLCRERDTKAFEDGVEVFLA